MKIVVAVKQVATLDDDFEILDDQPRVDSDSLEWELNEWDSFALEAALQLTEGGESSEVVVVTVDDESSEAVLRGCLARGAARAVRAWDPSLGVPDSLAVARVLAEAIRRESPDLILCGVQSADSANGATGSALAAHLDLPRVAVVRAITREGQSLTVERELEGGLIEVLRVGMPAVLTVQTGINEPRYANLRAIKQASEKPLTVIRLADLDLTSETVAKVRGARLVRLTEPQHSAGAQILDGEPAAIAARIAEIVKERLSR
jgi:electron transfer flavoprotein beta subunit